MFSMRIWKPVSCQGSPSIALLDGFGGQLEALVAGHAFPRARVQDQIVSAEGKRTFDLSAKRGDTFFADVAGLAADVDEIAGVDDERADIQRLAQCTHPNALCRVDLGGAPHARTRGEHLKCVGADFARTFDGVGRAARGA